MQVIKKAIYAGSFDPIHEGHISVIEKALKIFDELLVIVSINPDKDNQNDINERFENVKKTLAIFKNVKVLKNPNGMIADIAKKYQVNFLIRSARNETDYRYELVIAAANHSLLNSLETILIIPDYKMIDYSSTLIRHQKKLGKK